MSPTRYHDPKLPIQFHSKFSSYSFYVLLSSNSKQTKMFFKYCQIRLRLTAAKCATSSVCVYLFIKDDCRGQIITQSRGFGCAGITMLTNGKESGTGDRVAFFRTLTSNLSRELWASLLQKIVLAMLDNVTDALRNSWVHFSHRWCSKLQFSHL